MKEILQKLFIFHIKYAIIEMQGKSVLHIKERTPAREARACGREFL